MHSIKSLSCVSFIIFLLCFGIASAAPRYPHVSIPIEGEWELSDTVFQGAKPEVQLISIKGETLCIRFVKKQDFVPIIEIPCTEEIKVYAREHLDHKAIIAYEDVGAFNISYIVKGDLSLYQVIYKAKDLSEEDRQKWIEHFNQITEDPVQNKSIVVTPFEVCCNGIPLQVCSRKQIYETEFFSITLPGSWMSEERDKTEANEHLHCCIGRKDRLLLGGISSIPSQTFQEFEKKWDSTKHDKNFIKTGNLETQQGIKAKYTLAYVEKSLVWAADFWTPTVTFRITMLSEDKHIKTCGQEFFEILKSFTIKKPSS